MRSGPLHTSALLNKLIEIELVAGVEDPATIRKLAIEAQEILLGIQRDAVRHLLSCSHSTRTDDAGGSMPHARSNSEGEGQ